MKNIAVVINTLNEEKNLERAISSVKEIAGEIIVVDMHSDDATQSIARRMGATVYEHERTGYVEPARNFALSKATLDWILILDADEEIPSSLATQLVEMSQTPSADYYAIPRKNLIFGKWIRHSRWWPDYNIRFFKKGCVVWNEVIHSVPTTVGKGIDLAAQEDNAIIHHNYNSIDSYLTRLIRYSTEQAKVLRKNRTEFFWIDLLKKPSAEFCSRYFNGEGYKDGVHGLALAGLQAFSEFVLYLKLWELEKYSVKSPSVKDVISEMKHIDGEIRYWQADTLLKTGGSIVNVIKRKFKLP